MTDTTPAPTSYDLDDVADERVVTIGVHGWPTVPKQYGSTTISVRLVLLTYRRSTAPTYGQDNSAWHLASAEARGRRTRKDGVTPSDLDAETSLPTRDDAGRFGGKPEVVPAWLAALYARCLPTGDVHPTPTVGDLAGDRYELATHDAVELDHLDTTAGPA